MQILAVKAKKIHITIKKSDDILRIEYDLFENLVKTGIDLFILFSTVIIGVYFWTCIYPVALSTISRPQTPCRSLWLLLTNKKRQLLKKCKQMFLWQIKEKPQFSLKCANE